MNLPLSHYRTFAREQAGAGLNSDSGDRRVTTWINAALQRVWAAHQWVHARASGRFTMVPEESGLYLSLTQGSREVTLDPAQAEVFAEKYLDEAWVLFPSGGGRHFFELDQISDPKTARFRKGQEWPRTTSAATAYTWVRSRYELPEDFWRLYRAEDLDAFGSLHYLEPAAFDRDRASAPTQRGNRPWVYTVRGGMIEVWPGSGLDFVSIEWTYRRQPPRYEVATPGDHSTDWPDSYSHLLEAAILREASKSLGKNAPVPYAIAVNEYKGALKRVKGEDSQVVSKGGRMGVTLGHRERPFSQIYGITDA